MNTFDVVADKLRQQSKAKPARAALAWLEQHNVRPVSDVPARITVSEAARLWNTRLQVIKTSQPAVDMARLVQQLNGLTPQKKVEQFGFRNESWAAAFLFERADGRFVGAAIVKKETGTEL